MLSWRRFSVLIAAVILATPAFALEWHKAYERGRDRIEDGNCAEGLPLIQEAMQQNRRDDLRTPTYGTQVMEYFPHYYLAVCAFRSGKADDAARFLRETESGRITSSNLADKYKSLKSQIEALQKQQNQVKPPAQIPPSQQPEQPKPKVIQKPPPEEKPEATPAKPDNTLLIRVTLQQAKTKLDQGRFDEAKDDINRALQLDPSNRDARNLMNDVVAKQAAEMQAREKQQKFQEVEKAIDSGNLENAERLALAFKVQYPTDDRIAKLLKQIQDSRSAKVDTAQQDEVQKSVEHDVLIAYYRGEYGQAIRLANLGIPKAPKSWRLQFFLGCSYAALAILDANGTEDRMRLARESFRRARSISRSFSMPPYISPKILEIFRSS
jgi:tetratricopeptide (TPR) repeat protein